MCHGPCRVGQNVYSVAIFLIFIFKLNAYNPPSFFQGWFEIIMKALNFFRSISVLASNQKIKRATSATANHYLKSFSPTPFLPEHSTHTLSAITSEEIAALAIPYIKQKLQQLNFTTTATERSINLLSALVTAVEQYPAVEKRAQLQVALQHAFTWFNASEEELPVLLNQSVEAHHLYTIISRCVYLAHDYDRLQQDADLPLQLPPEPIGIIVTRHPCCPDPQTFPVEGEIGDLLSQVMTPAIKQKMVEKFTIWLALDTTIKQPSLYQEIKTNHHMITNLAKVHAQLAAESYVEKPLIELHSWTGYEADRNATTSRIVLLTKLLDIQQAIHLLLEQIAVVEKLDSQQSLTQYLEISKKILIKKQNELKPVWRLMKTLAAIDYLEFGPEHKFARDNLKQLFNNDPTSVMPFFHSTAKMYHLPIENFSSCRHILIEHIQKRLKASSHAINIETNLIALHNTSQTNLKLAEEVRTLLRLFQFNGFHFVQGQGRLDVKENIRPCASAILTQLGILPSKEEAILSQQIHHLLLQESYMGESTAIEIEQLDPEAQETYNHFLSIKLLNSINPNHMPILVMANFSTAADFMRSFLLAQRAGLIEIKNGKVVASQIQLIPLLESVEDHLNGNHTFEALFSDPLIHSYFVNRQEFCVMSAYSDTPREGTIPAAVLAITFGSKKIHAVFEKYFAHTPVKFRRQHGRGSSALRFGDIGVDSEIQTALTPAETIGHRRTWQSGLVDYECATPARTAGAIRATLHAANIDADNMRTQSELTDSLENKLLNFVAPGINAFRELTLEREGLFNQWLLTLPQSWEVLNERPLGSRAKDYRDLVTLPQSIVGGERMITVTKLLTKKIGFDFHTVVPFVASMRHHFGLPTESNAEKISAWQQFYHNNAFFKRLMQKIEEQIYLSTTFVLEQSTHDAKFKPLLNDLYRDYELAKKYLFLITGQNEFFADRPELKTIYALRREQLVKKLMIDNFHYGLDNPRDRHELASFSHLSKECRALTTGIHFAGRSFFHTDSRAQKNEHKLEAQKVRELGDNFSKPDEKPPIGKTNRYS